MSKYALFQIFSFKDSGTCNPKGRSTPPRGSCSKVNCSPTLLYSPHHPDPEGVATDGMEHGGTNADTVGRGEGAIHSALSPEATANTGDWELTALNWMGSETAVSPGATSGGPEGPAAEGMEGCCNNVELAGTDGSNGTIDEGAWEEVASGELAVEVDLGKLVVVRPRRFCAIPRPLRPGSTPRPRRPGSVSSTTRLDRPTTPRLCP